MVKWYKIPAFLCLLLLLSGCDSPSWATAGKIIAPVYSACPLEGKWAVVDELGKGPNSAETGSHGIGDSAQFTGGVALFGGYVWNNPTYKIKRVNSTDYLMTKYLNFSDGMVPHDQEVEVVTVYADSNFWGEFMVIDAEQMISFVQDKVLLLQKVSGRVDEFLTAEKIDAYDVGTGSSTGSSGVLLGLRIPSEKGTEYRTLWVAAENKQLHPVLSRGEIFFPRSSGFWELKVNDGEGGTRVFSAHDVSTKLMGTQMTENKESSNSQQSFLTADTNVIDYIGNDYVAIKNTKGLSRLQVLPVDNLSPGISLKLSDLLGNKGSAAYAGAREQAVTLLQDQGVAWLDKDGSGENFGLMRKNGHWYLTGSINYREGDTLDTMEFTINLIPPANLIFFDTLYLSWQNITDRVPDAVDAFTSPNKDIALIKTKAKLYIYGITAEKLDSRPLTEIKMEEGAEIVMAEWATASYVNHWEKTFLASGGQKLQE